MKRSLDNFPHKTVIGLANLNENYGLHNKKLEINNNHKFINYLLKNNINQLDWAFDYSSSFKIVEQLIKKGLILDTKISSFNIYKEINNLNNFIRNKLKFNIVYIRSPENLKKNNFKYLYKVLLSLKDQNLIKKIGYSVYDVDRLLKKNLPFPDALQIPINIFDQRFLFSGYREICNKNKIEVIARSIFLQGKLLNFSNKNYYINTWINFLNTHNLTPLQAIKSFLKSISDINKIIIGIDSVDQLKQFIIADHYELNIKNFYGLSTNNKKMIDPRYWKKDD